MSKDLRTKCVRFLKEQLIECYRRELIDKEKKIEDLKIQIEFVQEEINDLKEDINDLTKDYEVKYGTAS